MLLLATLAVSSAAQAEGTSRAGAERSTACLNRPYSYAGFQSLARGHGVSATVAPIASPSVYDGHVGGWIGVGGPSAGPGGVPQWIQVGLAAFTADKAPRLYYEVTVAGRSPRYVELAANVRPGTKRRLAVLELPGRKSWWRVWVDGRPVSPPIRLPGSHGKWYPQAVAENWNGNTGTCNGYAFRFTDVKVRVAVKHGTKERRRWQPFRVGYRFQDAGYRVVKTSRTTSSFVATSL